mmetsp:Transcript_1718/g.4150  ORF Transcript_1718/g.4150 Transcript_1718/m.4150 type:complete len:111 (-) Transcript_1718:107-439(-)
MDPEEKGGKVNPPVCFGDGVGGTGIGDGVNVAACVVSEEDVVVAGANCAGATCAGAIAAGATTMVVDAGADTTVVEGVTTPAAAGAAAGSVAHCTCADGPCAGSFATTGA